MAFYIFLFLTVVWFALMTWLSHQEGELSGEASRELAQRLRFSPFDLETTNCYLRRTAHVVVFAILAALALATVLAGRQSFWWLFGVVLWSWADEATKPLIPGRHFSWFDVGLNLLGALLGWAMVAVLLFCLGLL